MGQCQARAGGQQRSPSGDAEGPAYFQQWAERIVQMPPDRAASTMEALAEPDRLKVQRLVDQLSLQKGSKHTSPRSLSGSPRNRRALRSPSSSGHQYFQVQRRPSCDCLQGMHGGVQIAAAARMRVRACVHTIMHCQALRVPVSASRRVHNCCKPYDPVVPVLVTAVSCTTSSCPRDPCACMLQHHACNA